MSDLFDLTPSPVEESELVAGGVIAEVLSLPQLLSAFKQAVSDRETAAGAIADAVSKHAGAVGAIASATSDDPKAATALQKAIDKAEAARLTAQEAHTVAHATVERTQAQLEDAARAHYREMARDKRKEVDLDCPTWPAKRETIIDPRDPNHEHVIEVRSPEGCKCLHMSESHPQQYGTPWCASCQKAHGDGSGPHPVISEDQFVRRVLDTAAN